MSHILNEEIVAARRQRAAGLERIHNQTTQLIQVLSSVACSPLSFNKPQALHPLLEDLKQFEARVQRKLNLFRNGMVTICVAGVEKAGKTTMLKQLTGIEYLPTAPERCTSVSSEIVYTEQTPSIDIYYYSAEQLMELVVGLWKHLHDAQGIWEGDPAALAQNPPTTLRELDGCILPDENALNKGVRLKYKGVLKQLIAIQAAHRAQSNSALLGTTETGRPISELKRFVSHRTDSVQNISERQCLVRKVVIHAPFKGGSPALRLCDTPGVDDPNPNARILTIRAIADEADFLVILNCADNPDITDCLATFIGDVERLDQDSPFRSRCSFLINWNKEKDKDGAFANLRKKKVAEEDVFEDIQGPLDVTDECVLKGFMEHVNERLQRELPELDSQMIARMEDDFRSLQSRVRLDIYNAVVSQAPPLPEDCYLSLGNKYADWFKDYFKSLRAGLNKLTSESSILPEICSTNEEIKAILDRADHELVEWLSENANSEKCAYTLASGEVPYDQLLPIISYRMTQTVEELSARIETLSPAIQRQVKGVIVGAMGERIASALLNGNSDADGLSSLSSLMQDSAAKQENETSVCFIADALKEVATLDAQMHYVMRFEMRPCLNILDPFRWLYGRSKDMREHLSSKLGPRQDEDKIACISWLQNAELPSKSASPDEHAQFLYNVTHASFLILKNILTENEGKMQLMVDDFLSQASQTLGTQPSSRDGWFRGLQVYKNRILAEEYAGLEARSQEAKAFKQLQVTLNNALS